MSRIRCQVLAGLAVIALAAPLAAIEFRGGDQVRIDAGEIITDDLYASGESVIIDGVVQGDIVAVGRHIVLNGAALGDFIAAGQGVVVNGQVADDVRVAGFVLRFGESAAVGDDVVGAGFSLETAADSVIAGGLVFSGFQALLAGEIRERVLGRMAALRIEGTVAQGGEVSVEGGEPTPPFMQMIPAPVAVPMVPAGLTLGPAADVSGELVYTSAHAAVAETGSQASLTHVEVAAAEEPESFLSGAMRDAWRSMAILVVGLLVLLVAPGWLEGRSGFVASRPLAATGWGFVGLAGIPVLILLLAVLTILALILLGLVELPALTGATVGVALLVEGALIVAFLLSLTLGAPAVMSMWLGGVVRRSESAGRFLIFGLGWVLLTVLSLIPILGALVGILVVLLGLGSLVRWAVRPLVGGGA